MKTKPLKQFFLDYVSLTEKEEYDTDKLIDKLYDICGYKFTKGYIRVFLLKCIVNNPSRVKLGSEIDLFFIKNSNFKKLYIYKEGLSLDKYYYDSVESHKRIKSNIERKNKEYTDYLQRIKETYNSLPLRKTNRKYLVVAPCGSRKNKGCMRSMDLYDNRLNTYMKELYNLYGFDYYIISSKYGLISCEEVIEDYDLTIKEIDKFTIRKNLQTLSIKNKIMELINLNKYEIVFLVLGGQYLELLDIRKRFETGCKVYVFQAQSYHYSKQSLRGNNIFNINIEPWMIEHFNEASIFLKGKILREFVGSFGLDCLNKNPNSIQEYLDCIKRNRLTKVGI